MDMLDLIECINQALPPSVFLVVSGQVQGDFLQVIEEFSSLGEIKCVAFNHRGTLLAAGFTIGACVIWDFQTKNITSILCDKHYTAAKTSICWSKNDRCLLVSDIEKSLILWDAVYGNILAISMLQNIPMQVHLHPGSTASSVCLVSPFSSPPLIIDFKKESTTALPIALSDGKKKSGPFIPVIPTAACFNMHGDLVYIGNYKGEILIIDHENTNIRAIIPVPKGECAMIKNIGFSRNGEYLHTNSGDGILRIYKNLLPIEDSLLALNNETRGQGAKKYEAKNLIAVGSKCLDLLQEFPHTITKVPWKATCVSHDGEWVAGAPAIRDYEICVWDKAGRFVKIIDGPKEMLNDIKWHPVHPIILAVSRTGLLYSWGNDLTEKREDEEWGDEPDPLPKTEIETSQSLSPHLKKAGEDDCLKNIARGSREDIGRIVYTRRKRKASQPQADDVMKPPSK